MTVLRRIAPIIGLVLVALVLLGVTALLSGCAARGDGQRGMVDPGAFSFWIIGF